MRPRALPVVAVLAASLAGGATACEAFGTGIDDVSYLAFDSIPWPSVIAGDTLRDSLGNAAPLRASAFDASGARIVNADFRYFTLDTGVVVDSLGTLRATTRRDGLVRVIASLHGLQTEDRTVRVTRRPDSTFAAGATALTVSYALPDGSANVSGDLRITVVSRDTVGVSPNVGGWLVRWRTVHGADTLAAGDTTLVALQSTGGTRSATDTTGTDGSSVRRLRVFAGRLTAPVDSFIVLAEVRRHGTPLPGSPVRFVVRAAPPGP